MILAAILLGLALLVFGVVMFSPSKQWNIMRWFIALGLLLFVGGYVVKDHCSEWCKQSKCERYDSNCGGMDSSHGCKSDMKSCSMDEKCDKPCCNEQKCHGKNIEIEKTVVVDDEEGISLSIDKSSFKSSDNNEYEFTVVPEDGIVSGAGVSSRDGAFFFSPATAGVGIHKISVNDKSLMAITVE